MPDMRTERWVEHRAEMRERYVDSAMRTIDALGPHASMRDLAEGAKVPKPTLYRFFTDKSELADAIGDRIRKSANEGFRAALQRPGATGGQMVHEFLKGHLDRVIEHPHIFRFVLLSMSLRTDGTPRSSDRGRDSVTNITTVMTLWMKALGGTANDIELDAQMMVGMVMSAVDWWARTTTHDLSAEHFIEHLEMQVRAMMQATARANGVKLDFDVPIAEVLAIGKYELLS
ncbi:TetR/AcrR family transcriptional regulator [Nocardia nova]|uniref:TetR/AcrR family transcriptional regulator n=1 Tax=Nocardia nova TaxID=37330 RepID=UPI0033FF8620